jgi:hypothetical protein
MLTNTSVNTEIAGPSRKYAAYRLTIFRWPETRRASKSSGTRFSLLALAAILAITFLWSRTVDAVLSSGDAITYFKMLRDGSSIHSYRLQPTMFVVLSLLRPHTFADYILYSDAIPLTIMLYAFYRFKYSRIDQLLLIVFFSCSFYGVHFLLDFQRQFYAIAFFMLAVSMKRGSVLARIASIGSHAFSFTLYALWAIRNLRVRTAVLLCIPAVPAIYLLAGILDADKMADYSSWPECDQSREKIIVDASKHPAVSRPKQTWQRCANINVGHRSQIIPSFSDSQENDQYVEEIH